MKKLLVSFLALALLIPSTAFAEFSDMSDAHPYYEAVNWMTENGVIQGYDDGTFQPERCVNRVEVLKLLFLMNGTELITGQADSAEYEEMFSDVNTGSWYWPYLETALRRGTVVGYDDGTFKPEQCVNRVEAIKMAVLEFNEGLIPETDPYAGISLLYAAHVDLNYDAWYGPYMEYMLPRYLLGTEHEDMEDNPDSDWGTDVYYYPGDDMSRSEVSEMLYRMKALQDLNEPSYYEGMVPNSLDLDTAEESEEVAEESEEIYDGITTTYRNEDYDLHFMIPDGWEITSEEEMDYEVFTQLRLEMQPLDNDEVFIHVYTPPLEVGYPGFEIQDGIDHEIFGLELLSSWIGTNAEADRMMSRDAYAVNLEEWTTNIEFSLSTPNQGDIFDRYLEAYNGLLDTINFQKELTTYTSADGSLEVQLPAGWDVVEAEVTEYEDFDQFYLLLQERNSEDVYVSIYNPPLEVGYIGFEMEDGINYPHPTLDLVSSRIGVNSDAGRKMALDQYATDADDWNTYYEFLYSTPNSEVTFDEHLRDYKDIIDLTVVE